MPVVLVALALIILVFGFVQFFGPPYVPTLAHQKEIALDLLDLKTGSTLLELGSGDGRVLLAAAKRGYTVVGIELNPLLVLISYFVTLRYRRQVKIVWGNIWQKEWPPTDGIFAFLLPKYMPQVDKMLASRGARTKLASHAFAIPTRKADKEQDGVFLYTYR